ncbi:MAG: hypothetical protein B7X04_01735 [Parcubacteria group bacterium 21-54-25]|nr:MAG: hypothetical protein B7X04_01735 [Parcubacteria group bacterium 21-54-25]HQU07703.1 prepilin peptidase [Candidatus Paceibacterota bacterium]
MLLALSIFFFVLGAVIASFLGVVTGRLHTGEPWFSGRSRCDACGTALTTTDLAPILSWLVLLGHCRHCGARISPCSLIAEAVLGTLFWLAYVQLGLALPLVFFLIALSLLAALVLYDLRHTVVPAVFSLPFALVSVAFAALVAPDAAAFGFSFLTAALIGLSLAFLHFVSRGRAMGLADAPIAFSLALLAGPLAFSGFVYTFWIGAIIGVVILARAPKGHKMGIEVPFAPFLAAGFLLAFFSGWSVFSLITWIITR